MDNQKNIFPIFDQIVGRKEKEQLLNQTAKVIWMTGLSGSGKSTIAIALEKELAQKGFLTQVLDGDNIRTGINNNLGFSGADRTENIRRIAEVSKLFVNCGVITINCFVSPTNDIRNAAKEIIGDEDFVEVFIDTPIEICEQRDVKGLYKKARAGEIKDFTGVNAPFETPENATIVVKTANKTVEESVNTIVEKILPLISQK
ncbi:MAG: adenylyl-sulfate kinase [Flavobacteriales bacterium]|nr:adenylyl-sulfate kinase [Flavobacteriales bacterium]MCW8911691.1 adenylyl-sulfate kinase [Flavobacteriales bacterium]MCW8936950.1 adenylyl-sulfate kinase [Flavobacteriales bacterium]MCW8939278.1 adenylyl-sulfate kinase [Flavobacteriales bacterium]MCW8968736.1 adenylyl-sulfate kinase [Flavobacteriales bacterium]